MEAKKLNGGGSVKEAMELTQLALRLEGTRTRKKEALDKIAREKKRIADEIRLSQR